MKKICYYISNHGFGHASRSIAIIRYLQNHFNDLCIFIKTIDTANFIQNSLGNKVIFVPSNNDIGILHDQDSIIVNKALNLEKAEIWIKEWIEKKIIEEKKFCKEKEIDLIISDITPFPFLIANELKIPSIAISNFNWYDVYTSLGLKKEFAEYLSESYKQADLALILPFDDKMSVFKKTVPISLVSRIITEKKMRIFKKLGKLSKNPLIFLSIGKSVSSKILKKIEINPKNFEYLVSYDELSRKSIFSIPFDETESQNYVNACDLIVSKAGYSTVSEAVNSKIPLLLFKRPIDSLLTQYVSEDNAITNTIKNLKIGFHLDFKNLSDFNWVEFIGRLKEIKVNYLDLPERYKNNGCKEILDFVSQFLI